MRFRRSFTGPALTAALVVLLPVVSSAQIQTGTITGVVIDEQDAVLPGVSVTLTSAALICQQTVVTNERGVYTFIALPPGVYALRFELQGFAPVDRFDVPSRVAVVTTVDQMMKVATVTETITVSGERTAMTSKRTRHGQN